MTAGFIIGALLIGAVILFMRGGTGRIGMVVLLLAGASVGLIGDLSGVAIDIGQNVSQAVAQLGGRL